jgi:hypothetical protein
MAPSSSGQIAAMPSTTGTFSLPCVYPEQSQPFNIGWYRTGAVARTRQLLGCKRCARGQTPVPAESAGIVPRALGDSCVFPPTEKQAGGCLLIGRACFVCGKCKKPGRHGDTLCDVGKSHVTCNVCLVKECTQRSGRTNVPFPD